jgi:hypothetical protein
MSSSPSKALRLKKYRGFLENMKTCSYKRCGRSCAVGSPRHPGRSQMTSLLSVHPAAFNAAPARRVCLDALEVRQVNRVAAQQCKELAKCFVYIRSIDLINDQRPAIGNGVGDKPGRKSSWPGEVAEGKYPPRQRRWWRPSGPPAR